MGQCTLVLLETARDGALSHEVESKEGVSCLCCEHCLLGCLSIPSHATLAAAPLRHQCLASSRLACWALPSRTTTPHCPLAPTHFGPNDLLLTFLDLFLPLAISSCVRSCGSCTTILRAPPRSPPPMAPRPRPGRSRLQTSGRGSTPGARAVPAQARPRGGGECGHEGGDTVGARDECAQAGASEAAHERDGVAREDNLSISGNGNMGNGNGKGRGAPAEGAREHSRESGRGTGKRTGEGEPPAGTGIARGGEGGGGERLMHRSLLPNGECKKPFLHYIPPTCEQRAEDDRKGGATPTAGGAAARPGRGHSPCYNVFMLFGFADAWQVVSTTDPLLDSVEEMLDGPPPEPEQVVPLPDVRKRRAKGSWCRVKAPHPQPAEQQPGPVAVTVAATIHLAGGLHDRPIA
ncbi:hypothetical protein FIBSPDRAFT_1007881 [Athelia psychrophila]|uniref:Uncharacterized protein n=1 Tax=Athelia psychrophila TaxID=1759441 RepID=A0A166P3Q6_9AGAM|nr:hypothetical protein FIBSPDRAFT_1007881 [Fibularhizoctonia sp. CBS 109695]